MVQASYASCSKTVNRNEQTVSSDFEDRDSGKDIRVISQVQFMHGCASEHPSLHLDDSAVMDAGESDEVVGLEQTSTGLHLLRIGGQASSNGRSESENKNNSTESCAGGDESVQITCFSEVLDDVTLHFQILRLSKQIYAWVGCNSAKLGHLYAAAPTRPNNTVSVTSLLGGTSDNLGYGFAHRLVTKTGMNVILACNIPKNSPMLEAQAEKMLIQKLTSMGYCTPSKKPFS